MGYVGFLLTIDGDHEPQTSIRNFDFFELLRIWWALGLHVNVTVRMRYAYLGYSKTSI